MINNRTDAGKTDAKLLNRLHIFPLNYQVPAKFIEQTKISKPRMHNVIVQIDVSFSSVCPVIDHEFRQNIVKVVVDPRGDGRVDLQIVKLSSLPR